jgi:signal peptidase I
VDLSRSTPSGGVLTHPAGPAPRPGRADRPPGGLPLSPSRLPDTPAVRRARSLLDAPDPMGSDRNRVLIEWTAVLAVALLVALVVKVLLFQAFVIPSASMTPTLAVGDRVLVNKASYRVGDVGRGDLIVFERPIAAGAPDEADLIKRVIGLPGETVGASGGVVHVDGRPLQEDYLPRSARTEDFDDVTLGPDELWVMGDNRQNSRDSRVFGPVRHDLVIGRAFLRVWPIGNITRF